MNFVNFLGLAASRIRWLTGEYANVSRAVSVLVINELLPVEENS